MRTLVAMAAGLVLAISGASMSARVEDVAQPVVLTVYSDYV